MAPTSSGKQKNTAKGLSITALIVLIIFLLFSTNGLFRYYRLKQSLHTIRTANEELLKQNEQLAAEIERLKNDPEYLEEIARKHYGLIKKNEMIFNFKKKKR